ncbi:collagen alpha-1(I) chain-like [Odocoileus virginianus]|uniref:Collagen alpha-1(I) chain-like n=1 Tax=Odocoileus virginianus TaxID=9874 RepID=A0ABM4IMC4_ODOVR
MSARSSSLHPGDEGWSLSRPEAQSSSQWHRENCWTATDSSRADPGRAGTREACTAGSQGEAVGLGSVPAISARVDGPCATGLTGIILVTALLCGLEVWREPLRISSAAAVAGTRAEGPGSGWEQPVRGWKDPGRVGAGRAGGSDGGALSPGTVVHLAQAAAGQGQAQPPKDLRGVHPSVLGSVAPHTLTCPANPPGPSGPRVSPQVAAGAEEERLRSCSMRPVSAGPEEHPDGLPFPPQEPPVPAQPEQETRVRSKARAKATGSPPGVQTRKKRAKRPNQRLWGNGAGCQLSMEGRRAGVRDTAPAGALGRPSPTQHSVFTARTHRPFWIGAGRQDPSGGPSPWPGNRPPGATLVPQSLETTLSSRSTEPRGPQAPRCLPRKAVLQHSHACSDHTGPQDARPLTVDKRPATRDGKDPLEPGQRLLLLQAGSLPLPLPECPRPHRLLSRAGVQALEVRELPAADSHEPVRRAQRRRVCPECPSGPARPAFRPLKEPLTPHWLPGPKGRAGQAAVHTGLEPARSRSVTRARDAVSSPETAFPLLAGTARVRAHLGAGPHGVQSTAAFSLSLTVRCHSGPGQHSSFPSNRGQALHWTALAESSLRLPVPPAQCPPLPGVGGKPPEAETLCPESLSAYSIPGTGQGSGIAVPGAEDGSLRPVSDDRCRLSSPFNPDPSPTKPDLEPICQPTSLDEHAPPAPTLHSRSHQRCFALLSGPQGRRPVRARVTCPGQQGASGSARLSPPQHLSWPARGLGVSPPVPTTAPVLASKGPRGQPNSGADSHLPPTVLIPGRGVSVSLDSPPPGHLALTEPGSEKQLALG